MTASLLIELGCEELPANACRVAEREAGNALQKLLSDRRLAPTSVEVFVTPRRIAVVAEGVPAEAPAETFTHNGPPEKAARDESGAWTKAAEGFARKHGMTPDQLELRDGLLTATVTANVTVTATGTANETTTAKETLTARESSSRCCYQMRRRLDFARPPLPAPAASEARPLPHQQQLLAAKKSAPNLRHSRWR